MPLGRYSAIRGALRSTVASRMAWQRAAEWHMAAAERNCALMVAAATDQLELALFTSDRLDLAAEARRHCV